MPQVAVIQAHMSNCRPESEERPGRSLVYHIYFSNCIGMNNDQPQASGVASCPGSKKALDRSDDQSRAYG
jgi:hypothetical protein